MMGKGPWRHTHDVVVIGAGAAGLTAAGGCAMWGLKAALVERGAMGGECLNTGCVPSKALLAAAHRAQAVRDAGTFGVTAEPPRVDWQLVRAHIRGAIDHIAPADSRERFEAMGVEVIAGEARFTGSRSVDVAGRRLSAPRIVVATGSRPHVPDVSGLASLPFLTNETLFHLDRMPDHLLILGGGGVGVEMAQGFRRLGAAVTLVTRGRCLAREDEDAASVVIGKLRREGVRILEHAGVTKACETEAGIALHLENGEVLAGTHLLVATGRRPELSALNLEAADVEAGENGLAIDDRRRTRNRAVFAIGDCRAGPRFTHLSGHEGAIAALNIALGWPAKVERMALPRATYTDPELAQLGLTEAEAREKHGDISVKVESFAHDDRAVCEGDADGFVKAIWAGRRLAGVTIVGAGAGDLLLPWLMLMKRKASPFALADTIVAYPTRSKRSKAVAFARMEPLVFSKLARRWAAVLAWSRRQT